MNTDNIAYISDDFSLRRSWLFGMTFIRQIKQQAIVAVALILGLSIINISSIYYSNFLFKFSYFLLSLVISYLSYLSSLVFSSKDDTVAYLVPASVKEKFTFYALYSAVLFPLFVLLLYGIYMGVGSLVTDGISFKDYIVGRLVKMPEGIDVDLIYGNVSVIWSLLLNVVVVMALAMITLSIVLFSKKHRVIKAILTPMLCCLCIGIISGILGFIIGIKDGIGDTGFISDKEIYLTVMFKMNSLLPIATILVSLFIAGMAFYIYGRMKKQRVE